VYVSVSVSLILFSLRSLHSLLLFASISVVLSWIIDLASSASKISALGSDVFIVSVDLTMELTLHSKWNLSGPCLESLPPPSPSLHHQHILNMGIGITCLAVCR